MKIERVPLAASDHAIARYRERIGPVEGKDTLCEIVRGCTKCPDWLAFQLFVPAIRNRTLSRKQAKKLMRKTGYVMGVTGEIHLIDRDTSAVFVLKMADNDILVVITVVNAKPRLEAIKRIQE